MSSVAQQQFPVMQVAADHHHDVADHLAVDGDRHHPQLPCVLDPVIGVPVRVQFLDILELRDLVVVPVEQGKPSLRTASTLSTAKMTDGLARRGSPTR